MKNIDLDQFTRNMTISDLEVIKNDLAYLVNRFDAIAKDDQASLNNFYIAFNVWTEKYRDVPEKEEVA